MHQDVELMVSIQGVDLKAIALHREIARTPKEIAALEKALEVHKQRLEESQAALEAGAAEKKQIDAQIDEQRRKITKLKDQLMGAKTNEQLHAFQHEIAFCETEIGKFDATLAGVMERIETLDRTVRGAEADLVAEQETVAEKRSAAEARAAEDKVKLDAVLAERKTLLVKLSPSAKTLYDRLMKKSPGNIVSDATAGRCGACYLDLRPQLFQDLRKGDRMILCEHCGRLLHYNPAMTFDNQAAGPSPVAPAPTRRATSDARRATAPKSNEPVGRRVDMT